MPTIEFKLGIIPPKLRPRKGRGGRIYNPTENTENEGVIAEVADKARVAANIGDPTTSDVTLWLWVETPPRGDTDNSLKLLKDALQGVIYRNDVQVSREHIHRSRPGEGSYVRLTWDTVEECCPWMYMPTPVSVKRTRRAAVAR